MFRLIATRFIIFQKGNPFQPKSYFSSLAQLEVQKQQGIEKKEQVAYSNKPAIKKLLVARTRTIDGRNDSGKIMVRHRGGASHRSFIRTVNYNRKLVKNLIGKVIEIEHCPNRTSKIASVLYTNGLVSYIVAPENVKPGNIIYASDEAEVKVGNALPLRNIPDGTLVHNIEKNPFTLEGAHFIRAAGSCAQVVKKTEDKTIIKLASGKLKTLSGDCYATIGIVSNSELKFRNLRKAGVSRHMGRRPIVRGVAMNHCDHPHGRSAGKMSGRRKSYTGYYNGVKSTAD